MWKSKCRKCIWISFNVNYERAVKCIILHWQFHKYSNESYKWTFISYHVFKVSATGRHTRPQTVAPLVNRSVNNVLFKVKPSLHQSFLQVINVMNLCFVHALPQNTQISKYKAHDSGPFWWSCDTFGAILLIYPISHGKWHYYILCCFDFHKVV